LLIPRIEIVVSNRLPIPDIFVFDILLERAFNESTLEICSFLASKISMLFGISILFSSDLEEVTNISGNTITVSSMSVLVSAKRAVDKKRINIVNKKENIYCESLSL